MTRRPATILVVAALLAGCNGVPEPAAKDADDAVVSAQLALQMGDRAQALAEFERAIAINPTLTVAYLGAADIHRENGDYASAEKAYGDAATLEPRNFDAQYYHGLMLQLLDRVSEAVRAYLRALAVRPDDFNANLNLATAYLQMGEAEQALPYAERAVDLDDRSAPARVNLAAIYARLERHNDAIVQYQQAAELMELSAELLLNLADSLGRAERYAEMSNTLEQLVRLDPSALAHERLGSAYFRQKRYDEALKAFTRSLDFDANHYPALNGVGVCLLNRYIASNKTDLQARDEALRALRRSIQIERNQPRVVELLSRYG